MLVICFYIFNHLVSYFLPFLIQVTMLTRGRGGRGTQGRGRPNQEHHSPARVDGILYYSFSYAFDIPHYLVLYNICTFLF